jgi:hypothetical protein
VITQSKTRPPTGSTFGLTSPHLVQTPVCAAGFRAVASIPLSQDGQVTDMNAT